MDINEKRELNKKIRNYSGDNSFALSLKRHLKNNKYLKREKVGNRELKILSDKQYEVFKKIIESD